MRFLLGMILSGVSLATPIWAQEGPEWDLQRCIWRCLAASPGAASAEYNNCVAAQCSAEEAEGDVSDSYGQGRWFASGTGDGTGNLAGYVDVGTGSTFYVICGVDGRRNLALFGPEGPEAVLTLNLDGRIFSHRFVPYAGGYYARLPSAAPELTALKQSRVLVIRNEAGGTLFGADLQRSGAAAAITAACG